MSADTKRAAGIGPATCPHCGRYDTWVKRSIFRWAQIRCPGCGARGPRCNDTGGYPTAEARAAAAWQRQPKGPPPDALSSIPVPPMQTSEPGWFGQKPLTEKKR